MESILKTKVYLFFICFFIISCEITCDQQNRFYFKTFISMKVSNDGDLGRYLKLKGIDLISNKNVVFSKLYTWAGSFNKYIQKGDTVFKQKGDLRFFILKRNFIIASDYLCNNQKNNYCGVENIIINRQDTTKVQYEINAENEYFFDKCACKRDKTVKTIFNQIKSIKDSINNLKLRNF